MGIGALVFLEAFDIPERSFNFTDLEFIQIFLLSISIFKKYWARNKAFYGICYYN
jgi:hypothetical protein